ncbi:alpha/beta hydrolase [Fulvivirga maritima]|uniref:alpha/beta fold hydrolase n=1 Tax=Fulvivirga maritima TaxID=2904247 RepID=UPI001F3DAE93|nr:alpha/beta hydrolase [Fulvivirga maritima]UII24737.1 alpha/beta hydrolase [Fulvivirga maritima]
MPFIDINGLRTHYQELNPSGKETIIMIHGIIANLAQFYLTIAPELSSSYRVILYDIRGHGKTDMPASNYKIDDFNEDLLLLMSVLKIKKAHIIGFSFGGLIALKFAFKYPKRIHKLGIIECPNPIRPTFETAQEHMKEDENSKNPTDKFKDRLKQRTLKLMNTTTITQDIDADKDIDNESISQLKPSTLLLYGTHSDCYDMATRLITHAPNTTLKEIDGDHYFIMTKPSLVSLELKKFLSEPVYA